FHAGTTLSMSFFLDKMFFRPCMGSHCRFFYFPFLDILEMFFDSSFQISFSFSYISKYTVQLWLPMAHMEVPVRGSIILLKLGGYKLLH
ncbi:hypothetical protein L9F63_020391, partial [Diploptera punctata]